MLLGKERDEKRNLGNQRRTRELSEEMDGPIEALQDLGRLQDIEMREGRKKRVARALVGGNEENLKVSKNQYRDLVVRAIVFQRVLEAGTPKIGSRRLSYLIQPIKSTLMIIMYEEADHRIEHGVQVVKGVVTGEEGHPQMQKLSYPGVHRVEELKKYSL